jgi:uncharacterized membrane protein YvlD (DUF360 family)
VKPRFVTAVLAMLLAGAAAFVLMDALLSSVTVGGFWSALLAAAFAGVVNTVAWPAIIRFALPFTVLTLGLGVLVLNGLVVLLVAYVMPDVDVTSLAAAIAVALALTATTTFVAAVLAIDDDNRVSRHLQRRAAQSAGDVQESDVPGIVFLEIDGLAYDVVRRALRDGNAPQLARWIGDGSHRLVTFASPYNAARTLLMAFVDMFRLLPALREHPGIGFVLVRSAVDGAVVLGAAGERRLADGTITGADPLAPFSGDAAARHVARTDGFEQCPDILVNSTYWADLEEVAFEELVGSHGGLGGPQSFPFVLGPTAFAWPDAPIVGTEAMHRVMRRWLADLGQEAYGEP